MKGFIRGQDLVPLQMSQYSGYIEVMRQGKDRRQENQSGGFDMGWDFLRCLFMGLSQ